jgi:hypothetical protein
MVGSIGGLVDVQGPLQQGAGGGRLTQLAQHHGEGVQGGGDLRVARSVGGFVDV